MKNKFWRFLLICGCFVVLFTSHLFGQEFTGRVSDNTGAALAKTKVIVRNLLTNVDIATTTTHSGDYTVPYLKPGLYSVTAEAPGFKSESKTDITLQVGQTAKIDFTLEVGNVTETITVKAEALLDASKADRGEVVENERVTELPLNGRDPGMLSVLNAGAIWTGNLKWTRPFDDTQANLTINGGQGGTNQLLLDGVSNESPVEGGNGKIAYVPPVDSVQEFKIVTNPYDAQYGRAAGGAEDVRLKSGTNRVHGDAYEFMRRGWLDGNTWSNNYYGNTRAQHKLDQWGAELDGPVFIPKLYDGRDRTFFVMQYENWNEKTPNTLVESVADPTWLTGDFSNLRYWTGNTYAPVILYDPLTLHQDSAGTYIRDAFPGNIIPTSRINQVAKTILSYYPKPNVTPPSGSNPFENNYQVPVPTKNLYRNVLGKIDENIGSADRVSLRYGYWERYETRSANGIDGPANNGQLPGGNRVHTFGAEWIHTFTPNLLFNFRTTVAVRYAPRFSGPSGFPVSKLGYSSSQIAQFGAYANTFPETELSEFTTLGNWGTYRAIGNSLSMIPSVTWIKGKHTIHAGMDWRLLQNGVMSNQGGGMDTWTDRTWTQKNYTPADWTNDSGNSIASLLLGTATNGSFNIKPTSYWNRHYYAPFVQDDWKVSRKLTLNLGIRYDLNGPSRERQNKADYVFDPSIVNPVNSQVSSPYFSGNLMGGMTFLGVNGNPQTLYKMDKWNIQPRVGFAYALTDKTVLRGGIGEMFLNPTPGANQLGWSASTSYEASLDGWKTPTQNFSNPFPSVIQAAGSSAGALTGLGQSLNYINPKYKTPQFWSFSFGIQQQIFDHDTIEISYVGSRTRKLDSSKNINPISRAWQTQCNVELGGDPDICDNNYLTNPFKNVSAFQGTSYYDADTISSGTFTRPYPHFGDITVYQLNEKKSWYNSLQVTAMHKWSNSLVLHGTWTWSKNMNAGGWTDQIYGIPSRSIDSNDRTHRVTFSGVYTLPIGRGRRLLGKTNRLVDAAIGGWELAPMYIYETGTPWSVPSSLEYVHNAWMPRTTVKSNGYIRGVEPCVAQRNRKTGVLSLMDYSIAYGCTQPNFIVVPAYGASRNVVYSGIRIPSYQQFDANLSKNFAIFESMKLQLRLEAFNVLNHPLWQVSYDTTTNDSTFGQIKKGPSDQSNLPRQVQVAVKLFW